MTDKHPLKVLNQLWDTQDTYKNPYDLPEMHFLKNLTQKCGSQEKIGSAGSVKTLVANTYNELGELESKALGTDPQNTSNPLETLDYDYNVRGWLKSINGDYVANGTGSHYFGMDLSYDFGFESNRLNGNIAGVKWRTRSSPKMRAYGFDYDPVNRLLKADYHQKDATVETSWSKTLSDFSTSYGYDANGNILNLTRKGVVAGTITTIDQLTYDYGAGLNLAGASNQLMAVYDPQGDLGQGDFKDGNVGSDDYSYDANGNMKDDMNKGISNITYNHLNLPVTVSFGSTKTITYVYDAAGIKLAKVVDDNGSITTTDYAAGFIYENDELQHFAHEEGRVRLAGTDAKYDYFIKDHLGNTRMTLTEARDSTVYDATMETSLATFEESVFLNIAETRSSDDAFEGSLSAKLGPESIGPAKMLVVSPGDTVDLSVYAQYASSFSSTTSGSSTNLGTTLAALFGATGGGASVYEQGVYNNLNNGAGTFLASVDDTGSSTVPKAYLNYIFFDQDFNLEESASGYVKITASSEDVFDLVEANGLIMPEAGYLYVYLSNEGHTSDGGDVYFDVLRINHKKGHILQEDHYYPFGLTIQALSSSAPLSKPNNFKYNGFEQQTEFGLGWYDYQARQFDPQLGRFLSVDPAADLMRRHSPYNYAFDNPIRFIDPDGMMATEGGQCPDGNCEGNSGQGDYVKSQKDKCETGDCEYVDSSFFETTNDGKGKVGLHAARLDIRHKEGDVDVQFTGSLFEGTAQAKGSSGFYAESSDKGNKGKAKIALNLNAEVAVVNLDLKSKVGDLGIEGGVKVLGAKADLKAELSQNAIGAEGELMAYVGKGNATFSVNIFGLKIGVEAEVYDGAIGAGGSAILNLKERKATIGGKGSIFYGGGLKLTLNFSKWLQ